MELNKNAELLLCLSLSPLCAIWLVKRLEAFRIHPFMATAHRHARPHATASTTRHDSIYCIFNKFIDDSRVECANIVKQFEHLNSWENWMQMVSMEAAASQINANILLFCSSGLIAFVKCLLACSVFVSQPVASMPFHECRRKNEKPTRFPENKMNKIELIRCHRSSGDDRRQSKYFSNKRCVPLSPRYFHFVFSSILAQQ